MKATELDAAPATLDDEDDGPPVGLVDLLTWIGEGKRTIGVAASVTTPASTQPTVS